MAGRFFAASEVAKLLKRVAIERSRGLTLTQAVKAVGVPYGTYHRWVRRFGGLDGRQIQIVRDLSRENARLRRALEELDQPAPVTIFHMPAGRMETVADLPLAARTSRETPLSPLVSVRRTHH